MELHNDKLQKERDEYRKLFLHLREENERLKRGLLGQKAEREGTDAFECIGSDTREVLERRPASTVVVKLVYKKFVRKDRDRLAQTQVLVQDTVELPIERGTAGPGMLADTLVRRFQDHQ